MDNQRIPAGTLLGTKDLFNGGFIQGVSAEAVNGFGGEGDQSAGPQDGRRFLQPGAMREAGIDLGDVAGGWFHGAAP